MYFKDQIPKKGFTKQESILWEDFTSNQFGKVYL